MRGDCGVAGEGRLVGVPKFHSWAKCTMPLTNNITSDWMSNASFGLCISLSEPHTSGTALQDACVCLFVCLRPYTVNFKCA